MAVSTLAEVKSSPVGSAGNRPRVMVVYVPAKDQCKVMIYCRWVIHYPYIAYCFAKAGLSMVSLSGGLTTISWMAVSTLAEVKSSPVGSAGNRPRVMVVYGAIIHDQGVPLSR
jgi:hypothetical protein